MTIRFANCPNQLWSSGLCCCCSTHRSPSRRDGVELSRQVDGSGNLQVAISVIDGFRRFVRSVQSASEICKVRSKE